MSPPQVVLRRRLSPFAVPLLLLFLLCLSVSVSPAQAPALQIGARVRLSAPVYRGMAVISDQNADALTLRVEGRDAPVVVPWTSITSLTVRVPRSRGQGARHGTKWGLGIGAAAGLFVLVTPAPADETASPVEVGVSALVAIAGLGAMIGALLPGTTWQDVGVVAARETARLASIRASTASDSDSGPIPALQPATALDGATPRVELTIGLSGPELPQAQLPGVTASLALNRARNSAQGAALVTQIDLISYLRRGVMAGPRLYGRSASLFGQRRALTYFGQVLLGAVVGEASGVIRSNGGFGIQPGVGADWGRGARAIRVQFDYRIVPGGIVEDSRLLAPQIASLSGPRVVLGGTWRFRCKGADPAPCK